MLFSIYYRIEHREEFLKKYLNKCLNNVEDAEKDIMEERINDLFELLVNMIITKNKNGLFDLLTKKNTKTARIFFNYLTCSKIRSINKEMIISRLNEIFKM